MARLWSDQPEYLAGLGHTPDISRIPHLGSSLQCKQENETKISLLHVEF